jgi:hypothetical protein
VLISYLISLSSYPLSHLVDGSATVRRFVMNEYPERDDYLDDRYDPVNSSQFEDRDVGDRRTMPSEGFAYISTVGMIDRRERIRRKDDPFVF